MFIIIVFPPPAKENSLNNAETILPYKITLDFTPIQAGKCDQKSISPVERLKR